MCAALSAAWLRAHDDALAQRRIADCFRSVAEESRLPQDRECAP